jgi:geranylgeranyl reductase family protein
MHDVIVVGAGPAGSLAARSLAEKGYDVLVLENHSVPGLPQHCTGLISEETIAMSGVKPNIINTLYGAEFVFPNGKSFTVRSEKPKGYIVDRADLDRKMADAAKQAGAVFSFSDRYVSHTIKDAVFVDTENATYKSKAIIGADGVNSVVSMTMGENRPKEYVRGIQADVDMRMDNQDVFKVFVGNTVAPGFFAWQIPCGDFTRIGLCISGATESPSEYLSQRLIEMGVHDKVLKVYSGKIPLGGRPFVCGDRCMLIGDAAGHVKPLSGGGLYPAFRANSHLVKVLSSCLDANTLTSKDLTEYSKLCNADFGKELDLAYMARKKFKRMTDNDLNKGYDYVMKNNLVPVLNDMEIDHPTEVVKKVLKRPKALIKAVPLYLRTLR